MRIWGTPLEGVFRIDPELRRDERGFFARTWCVEELGSHGLEATVSQCSISWNEKRGTLRGMHWQEAPWEETKIIRCTRGRIYDVALDLRRQSPTFMRWYATELSEENRAALYVPRGVAHGFQSLEDGSEVLYMIAGMYHAESARGVRWDDPAFAIEWPLRDPILSERDRSYPDFSA